MSDSEGSEISFNKYYESSSESEEAASEDSQESASEESEESASEASEESASEVSEESASKFQSPSPYSENKYESATDAVTAICVHQLLNDKSVCMESKIRMPDGTYKQAYRDRKRQIYCTSDIDHCGCLKETRSCSFFIELRLRKGCNWIVWKYNGHSQQCMCLKSIPAYPAKRVALAYLNEILDPIVEPTVSSIETLFAKLGVTTHVDGDTKADKRAKKMFLLRVAREYKRSYSSQASDGYSTVESLLANFCEINPGSLYKVEVDKNNCFKRAFLLCGQFARVLIQSEIRFTAIDAGNSLLLNYLLL